MDRGTWRLRAYLKAPTPTADDWFGSATAVSGDGGTVVVGERFRDEAGWPSAGKVYVFRRGAEGYALAQTITSPQVRDRRHFGGHALALTPDGTALAIGEIGDTSTSLGANSPLYFCESVWSTKASNSRRNFSTPSGPSKDSLKPKNARMVSALQVASHSSSDG